MASRERVIALKRKILREESNALVNLINDKSGTFYDIQIRYERVKTLFNAYEELHEELVLNELDVKGQEEMTTLKERFLKISAYYMSARSKFEQTNIQGQTIGGPMGNSTFLEKQKQLKLPIANLPKFSGDVERWWFFKRNFQSMVGSRTDIDKVVKFHYLQGCLEGEAANKLSFYDPSDVNYDKAWEVLTDAYERKRVLLHKHIDMILNISPLTEVTHETVGRLIDDARQNIHLLDLENCTIDSVIVRILERALPLEIRTKWEESLGRDEIPSFKKFDDFLVDTASRMRSLGPKTKENESKQGNKRPGDNKVQSSQLKNRKFNSRSLVTFVSNCPLCQGEHPLFKCPNFEKSNLQQRWDLVKTKQLCRNCLRKHEGQCASNRRCKQCNKFHHSLLHNVKANSSSSVVPSASTTKSDPKITA